MIWRCWRTATGLPETCTITSSNGLFAVGLALQSTHRREKSPRQAARLADHIDQLHDVIQEIRTTIFDLQADPNDTQKLRNTCCTS